MMYIYVRIYVVVKIVNCVVQGDILTSTKVFIRHSRCRNCGLEGVKNQNFKGGCEAKLEFPEVWQGSI